MSSLAAANVFAALLVLNEVSVIYNSSFCLVWLCQYNDNNTTFVGTYCLFVARCAWPQVALREPLINNMPSKSYVIPLNIIVVQVLYH
jgi:hypothetical protein